MNRSSDIALIIKKYSLHETLSEDEKNMLKEWLSEDSQNIEILNQIFSCEDVEYILNLEKSDIATKISSKLNIRIYEHRLSKIRKRIYWLTSTAAVSIIFAIIMFIRADMQPEASISDIVATAIEEEKIVLITPAGEIINLENNKEKEISEGISIDSKSNTIKITNIDNKSAVKKVKEHRIKVPLKKEINLILADGTAIWLNSGSEIIFPTSFEGDRREVTLVGEAFFDVAKDETRPFIVKTKILDTEVTGTQFLVSSYDGNQTYKVLLAEGSVKVSSNVTKHKTTLSPGKGVEFNTEKLSYKEVDVDVKQVYAIKNGEFIFKNATLKEITDNLKYWYGVEFKFAHKELEDIRFYMESSKYDNLEGVLILLKATNEINYQIDNNIITIKERSL